MAVAATAMQGVLLEIHIAIISYQNVTNFAYKCAQCALQVSSRECR